MKKIFLLLLFIISSDTYAVMTTDRIDVDSIIVNIGKRKRIILWGETKEDLKALEKYDLNRIVKQMNQDLEEMPANVRRSIRQDYEGNNYTKEASRQRDLEGLTPWQRLTRNTYLNISLGFTSVKFLQRGSSAFKNSAELFRYKTLASPNLSIGLMRQESFIRTGRKELLLRYGIDISWYYLSSVSTKKTSYLLRVNSTNASVYDTVAIYRPAFSGNYYTVENYQSSDNIKRNPESTYNQSLFYANFKINPTVNFYGANNQKTFHFGFGAYIGRLIGGSQILSEIKAINQREAKIPVRSSDNPYRYGLLLDIGYKAFSLFLEGDVNNFFQRRDARNGFLAYESSDKWSQNLTTFGIRIGR